MNEKLSALLVVFELNVSKKEFSPAITRFNPLMLAISAKKRTFDWYIYFITFITIDMGIHVGIPTRDSLYKSHITVDYHLDYSILFQFCLTDIDEFVKRFYK